MPRRWTAASRPATIVVDAPIEVNTPQGVWRPKNSSNKFYGPTPLRTGIEQSRNLMTVRLAQEVGMDTVADYAERFGVYDEMGPFLANALGSEETTLYRMVAAYAMFANGGERVSRRWWTGCRTAGARRSTATTSATARIATTRPCRPAAARASRRTASG